MGSLPRLKIKDEIKYRKGSTNESMNCRHCVHFTAKPSTDIFVAYVAPGTCKVIGERDSVRYRVREDYRCDRQEYGGRRK